MKFIVLFLALASSPVWATDQVTQSEFSSCIFDGYYQQNDGPNSCDFSNVRINFGSVIRGCSVKAFENTSTDKMVSFMRKLDEMKTASFKNLNKDLNNKLYSCGYMGEIELTEDSGKIKIFEFSASTKSCDHIASLIKDNNQEYLVSSPNRKDELRDQNLLLNNVSQRANCNNISSSKQESTGSLL